MLKKIHSERDFMQPWWCRTALRIYETSLFTKGVWKYY